MTIVEHILKIYVELCKLILIFALLIPNRKRNIKTFTMKLTTPEDMAYPIPNTDAICALIETELAKDRMMENVSIGKYSKQIVIDKPMEEISYDERYEVKQRYQKEGWDDVDFNYHRNNGDIDTPSKTSVTFTFRKPS
jgi:hypothetical protein